MKNVIARRSAAGLGRLRLLGPVLVAAAALIVAACNNGSGGSGY
jgi:predicted small secreted protein